MGQVFGLGTCCLVLANGEPSPFDGPLQWTGDLIWFPQWGGLTGR